MSQKGVPKILSLECNIHKKPSAGYRVFLLRKLTHHQQQIQNQISDFPIRILQVILLFSSKAIYFYPCPFLFSFSFSSKYSLYNLLLSFFYKFCCCLSYKYPKRSL